MENKNHLNFPINLKVNLMLLSLILMFMHGIKAQNTITINVTVNPPYSTNFEDYVGISANNVIVNLSCSPSANGLQSFYLAGQLSQSGASNPFTIAAPVNPRPPVSAVISMLPGSFLSLRGSDLQPYFDESRTVYENISQQQINTFYANKFIPEGSYQICLTAHDFDTQNQISLASPSGCSNIFELRNLPPPSISYPNCVNVSDAGHLQAGAFQNILFQWNAPVGLPISANLAYTFQMVEVPLGMNPNQIFQNTTYIPFEINTGNQTSFFYNQSHPPLQIGKRYAIRIRAEDYSNQYAIQNNGYSEVCSFIYGLPQEIENFDNATLLPIANLTSSSQLFYFEEYLESNNNLLRVQQAINSNSSNVTHPSEFTINAKIKAESGSFEISTKQEISIENILQFNTSNMMDVLYHGNKISKAFGDFEEGKFNFTGNEQLLRNYLKNGVNKFILPPGPYTFEIQLMAANGITPISQNSVFNFSVSYPYIIQNIAFPPSINAQPAISVTASDLAAISMNSASAFNTNQQFLTRFALEIHSINDITPSQQFKIKINTPADNCAFYTNTNGILSTLTFEKLLCLLKQWNAGDFKIQTGGTGSWINLPDAYIANGKIQLPAGNYRLYLKSTLKNSEIPLIDPNTFIAFNTSGEPASSFPLLVETQLEGPIHGFKRWVENSESSEFIHNQFIRSVIVPSSTTNTTAYTGKLRFKIERIEGGGMPAFVLKLKDTFTPESEFTINNESITVKYPENLSAFGNFNQTNWELSNSSGIPIEEVFPNGEMRLPPGQYRLYSWISNSDGTADFSDPNAYEEFVLTAAIEYQLVNERTLLPTGRLKEYYAGNPPPKLIISKTKDASAAKVWTFASIICTEGALSGKKFELKQQQLTEQGLVLDMLNSTYTYNDLATVMANSAAHMILMDGAAVPEIYSVLDSDYPTTGLRFVKLPIGKYQICYQTYSENLHFKLGPENGYCRSFDIEGGSVSGTADFNCTGTTPPNFQLRAVYPSASDTLPFRMFPFIVQFCPYSNNFRGIKDGSFTATSLDGSVSASRTGINNNWPNGPQISQFNAINGYHEVGDDVLYRLNPQFEVTEQMSTLLPVYENHNNVLEFPESIFKRGDSYKWSSTIPLRFSSGSGEVVNSQNVENNAFGLGMPKPILNEPANNSTVPPGKIRFKFRKGRMPASLLPPLDILQTQRLEQGGHRVLTYDGIVKEAFVLQISTNSNFSDIIHTEAPVQLRTSYRELISRDDPSELIDLLYGNVEIEIDIAGGSDYFWRVSWLNNPEDENSGFYNSSAVYKFTLGDPNALPETDLNCGTPVTNTTFYSWGNTRLVDKNICIGKFTMQVKEIKEKANQTYEGYGIIQWMDIPFKTVFSNLKINADRQVYDGIARVERQIPSEVANWIRANLPQLDQALTGGSAGVNNRPITNTSASIVNQIYSISNLFEGKATVPYGLNMNVQDMEGQNRNFIFAIMDMEFTKTEAKISTLLDLDVPHLAWLFELASTGVTINPNGFDGDYTLFLPKDKEVSISDDVKLAFSKCSFTAGSSTASPVFTNDGTYFKYRKATDNASAYWEAGLGVKLKIDAGENEMLVESVPNDNYVTFQSQSIFTSGQTNGFIFSFSTGEKFGFNDVPDLEMSCIDLVLDLSASSNNSILTEGKLRDLMGTYYVLGANKDLFKGMYFKEIKGKYKKVFGPVELSLKDLLIDFSDGGFYGSLGLGVEKVKLGGWAIKDNELGVKFQKSFKEAYLKGKIPLPIAAGDPLKYTCNIKKDPTNTMGLNFVVETGEELNADAMLADIRLNNSSVKVTIPFDESAVSFMVDLSGTLLLKTESIPSGQIRALMPSYAFEHLKLSSKEFEGSRQIFEYLHVSLPENQNNASGGGSASNARLSEPASGSNDGNVHGFAATFSKFGLHVVPSTAGGGTLKAGLGIKFDLDLKIGPSGSSEDENTQFSVSAGGNIRIVGGNVTYNSDEGFGFEFAPSISLGETFRVSGKIGPVTITEGSQLSIYKASENPTMGDGVNIKLGVEIALGSDKIGGTMEAKFGNVNNYKYFGLGIQVNLGSAAIPIAPPFSLTGIGGGFAINMRSTTTPQTITKKDFASYTCGSGNTSMLNGFTPQSGNHYFYANATGNVKDDKTFIACLELQAAIENARLARLSIFGKGMLMPKDNKGIVEGVVDISLINTESMVAFDLYCAARTNPPIPGITEVSLRINITQPTNGEGKWFMLFGKPGAPNVLSMAQSIPGVGSIDMSLKFYFLMGNDMQTAQAFNPPKPTPQLILNAFGGDAGTGNEAKRQKVQEYFAAYQSNIERILGSTSGSCGSTGGFAFGAEYNLNMDISFLILYFKFDLLLGFDMALLNYTPGCFDCGSEYPNPGMNNHYAMGQMYAGMHGDLGLQIDLWFWEGRASLFKAYVAAMLQGGGPNPWWGKGGVVARGEVLGGLASVNTEFKFSFGTQCTTPAFNIADIKVINEINPDNGQSDVDIFSIPSVSFNNAVSEIRYSNAAIGANTNRNADLTPSKIKTFNVDYEDQNGEWVNRVFCFALNRFEMQGKPKIGGEFTPFANYSVGEGRPVIAADGMTARVNMMNTTLNGEHEYKLVVEVEALERIDGNWASPNKNQNRNQTPSRERRTENRGITEAHKFSTGEAPTSIPNDRILYTTPLPDQNNFHPGDVDGEKWSIVFKTEVPGFLEGKPYVIQTIENADAMYRYTPQYMARFIDEDGNKTERSIASFSSSNLNWTGTLPKTLNAGKVYRLEIIKTWVGINPASQQMLEDVQQLANAFVRFGERSQRSYGSNTDTASAYIRSTSVNPSISNSVTQSLVYAWHFRVSKYKHFAEKLQAMPLTASRLGAKIIYTSANNSSIEEPFDIFDVGRYTVFAGSNEEFPPLYSLSFLPEDNRAASQSSKNGPLTYTGGMESLSKMYRDGFHFFRANLSDLPSNQGLLFREFLMYNDNSGNNRQVPIRANPNSEDARFANSANRLPYFPNGAINTTFTGLKGRLTYSERYRGALNVYNNGSSSVTSSANSSSGKPSAQGTSAQGIVGINGNSAHMKLSIEIQEVVNRDFKLYREILKKASEEINRLKKNAAGNSNQPLLDDQLTLISNAAKNHVAGSNLTINGIRFTLTSGGRDFMIRLFATNQAAFSSFASPSLSLDQTLNNMHFALNGFELNRPGMHPQIVTTIENAFISELKIDRQFVRMHHAMQVYNGIFNKINPNPNMIDTYISSMGIDASDVFKNLNNLTFRVKYSGFGSQSGTYFNSNTTLPVSGSLPNKGSVQFIKP
jgi:hypothetical protein